MKTKVIYLLPALTKAGPVEVVLNLVRHIDCDLFIPIVVGFYPPKSSNVDYRKEFIRLGIELVEYNYTKWEMELYPMRVARELISRFGTKNVVYHAHCYHPALVAACLHKWDACTVNTIHNICDEDYKMKGPFLCYYMSHRFKCALRKIVENVAISDFMNRYYSVGSQVELTTVYNGVEMKYVRSSQIREQVRKELGIHALQKVFLCPASFIRRKNQQEIISFLRGRVDENFVILFAGTGICEEECKVLVGDDSRFRFLEFQMDLSPYWEAADALISASCSEGLPMSVLEAIGHGLPCLLSDIPPHREIVENVFGTSSLLFALGDSQSFMSAFDSLLLFSVNDQMLSRAKLLYSSESMALNYMQLYRDLLNK